MKRLLSFTVLFLSLISLACTRKVSTKSDRVKLFKETIIIPSYPVGDPEKNPIFYTFEECQGAQSRVYPYPLLDKLTDEKVAKSYTGLFLENEYLKICVLPELGGRLYIARDKTNDYDFIYHNGVIKPALIGMAGAWISGGIEWNIPHHHRVSTLMPVDYTLIENPDGSKTIWVGEYEKRHHAKWLVGLTLFPGRSYIETEIRLFNATPIAKSALIWINPAVHVNKDYQVVFPPDVTKAVYHHKIEFTDWPISRQFYLGQDFTEGVDISWWKNTKSPTSFFAWDTKSDFLAGIDHGKNAGTVLVANRHIFPGKKMWNWGNNEIARLWDQMLTDTSGPYIELMMGAYSDNQPDYSWYQPYAVRKGTMHIYPVKEMEGIKQANQDLAANLEFQKGAASIQLCGTASFQDLTMTLSRQNELLSEHTFDLEPGQTISWHVETPAQVKPADLILRVISKEGKELLNYKPPEGKSGPHPDTYSPPRDPDEYQNLEDLYLAGLRLEQFGNPDLDPNLYWEEVLKRDPDNIWVNTLLGMKQLEQYDYEGAEKRLGAVVEKITGNYTSPKFGEPLYYLGVALMNLDRPEEAYEILYKAAWHLEWASAAYFLIATLDCKYQTIEKALAHLNLSLESNQNNLEALQLKAIVLRYLKDYEKAFLLTEYLQGLDPLNFIACMEQYLLSSDYNTGYKPVVAKEHLQKMLRNEPDNYLEAAARYGNAGFYKDAASILELASGSDDPRLNSYPMIYYHLGYYSGYLGDEENSLILFRKAGKMPRDYCFPHLPASEKALQASIQENPEDANAYNYLGNLYCDFQPERSLDLWEKAIDLDPTVAVYYRNAAFVQANYQDDMELAATHISKAAKLDPTDPLYLLEQDRYLAYMNKTPENRLNILETNSLTVHNSDATLARLANLLVINGRYDDAIQILTEWHFHSAEDAGPNVHEQWTDAHMLRGKNYLEKGAYDKALSDFQTAMQFPRNLESATDSRIALAYYFIAETYKMQGKFDFSMEYYRKMIDFEIIHGWREEYWPDVQYYRALARKSLGEKSKAYEIFNELIRDGQQMVNGELPKAWYLSSVKRRQAVTDDQAKGYFSEGLGYLGLGEISKAKKMFLKTLAEDRSHLGARQFMLKLSADSNGMNGYK